jgi:hypothetical protein
MGEHWLPALKQTDLVDHVVWVSLVKVIQKAGD